MRASFAIAFVLSAAGMLTIGSSGASAQPLEWRVTKTEWTAADEKGFGDFVAVIAESGCTTTISCMRSAANFYHDSDPASFQFHADCAKWVYMLRAYYASKNGLPFSYVSRIAGEGDDLRFSKTSNRALARRDLVDGGSGIAVIPALQALHDQVWTATYRMDPAAETPVEQDFYSPKIQPGSIRPGTAIYDINGHVGLVYDVTADGRVLYMDAYPDEHVARSFYGLQFGQSPAELGGGFKNFRPLKLIGATQTSEGAYIGGAIVLAPNEAIADYSLEQYRGNVPNTHANGPGAQFRYNNISLGLFEYARASMSGGGFAFNPVYEMKATLRSLCRDAKDATPTSVSRLQIGFATLHRDLSEMIALWEKRDLRVVYDGRSLKETLSEIYAAEAQACSMHYADNQGRIIVADLDLIAGWAPETDVRTLIDAMDDLAPFAGMRPVGY
ncbi:MAG TPA: hypothetical protein VK479_16110 [Micropepsaceae bacterium]|nr:hypothetical protein [Micropepsaceae bacterium]